MRTNAGDVRTEAHACRIYVPGSAQDERARFGDFGVEWVLFGGPDVPSVIAMSRLPIDRVFYPARPDLISESLRSIRLELQGAEEQWEHVASLMVELLLVRLGRYVGRTGPLDAYSARRARRRGEFTELRARLSNRLAEEWAVSALASEAHLSAVHFTKLYREFFGVSPLDDLIRMRVDRACWLLTNENLSMSEVARACGFGSLYYFSRVFRKRMGSSPSGYRARVSEGGAGVG
jgi:AraC-like DNA-binding protein